MTTPTRLARFLAVLVVAVGLASPSTSPAAAADLSQFDPGLIISDSVFYDSGTMSAAQVQAFLVSKGAACKPAADGTPCLKDYRLSTPDRVTDGRCAATYPGAADETAAAIVVKVAAACGINPQVLLVTLQKEQGLVTRTTAGTAAIYQKAMGYGCPDTAACDALYYGFFNQVYSAAAQLQRYAKNPLGYSHIAGRVNSVRFNPNTACGATNVYIQNQATASLYNYTPYQPNAAALAAGYGTGDACSSYGNRNFWNYFTDWFGSTTQRPPFGALDGLSTTSSTISVSGWAIDPDTTAPITVHVYVDGVAYGTTAANERPDVDAAYHRGSKHGFAITIPASLGNHSVCVLALDATNGPASGIACTTVSVVNSVPFGSLEELRASGQSIVASGWAIDPDTTAPITVHVYVDGVAYGYTASIDRPDLDPIFHRGGQHGFAGTIPAAPGPHQVCLFALDSQGGVNGGLSCQTVVVPGNRAPVGRVDAITGTATSVQVSGWTFDPDTAGSIPVHVYVDGVGVAQLADQGRPDVAAAFGIGPAHGFGISIPAAPGRHQVCVYAIDAQGGLNSTLGCGTAAVVNPAPFGNIEAATAGAGTISFAGWALDPGTTSSVAIHVYVDGVGTAYMADASRPDVAAAFGLGDLHGFNITVPATAGQHQACAYAIDTQGGTNTLLGCRTLTVTP